MCLCRPKSVQVEFAHVEEKLGYCYQTSCLMDESVVHVPEGGVERYLLYGYGLNPVTYAGHEFERNFRSAATLIIVSGNPIRYERQLPDGSKEVYDVSDGASQDSAACSSRQSSIRTASRCSSRGTRSAGWWG